MEQLVCFFTFAAFFFICQVECVQVGTTAKEEAAIAGYLDDAECGNIDAKDLDGQIVYFESDYYNTASWLSSQGNRTFSGKYYAAFRSFHIEEVVEHLQLKWLIKDVGDGEITLQNMNGSYIYLHTRKVDLPIMASPCPDLSKLDPVMATTEYSSKPGGDTNTRFMLKCIGNTVSLSSVYEYALRYVSNICGFASNLGYITFAELQLYTPPKDDSFAAIATLDNSGSSSTVTYQYSEEIGMSRSNGQEVSESLEVTLGIEIKSALSFGTSHSGTWATASSETYSRAVTHTVTVQVGPFEKLQVQQLIGTYSHYQTGAACFKFVTLDSTGKATKTVYANSAADYNRGNIKKNDC